jgi:CHASE3 domain sensor protein
MRLRRRVQLLVLAFVALLGLNVALAARLTIVRDRTAEVVEERLNPARNEVAALLNALISQETGQRGYIITGQEEQLSVYVNGRRAAAGAVEALRRHLAAEPALLAGVQASAAAIAQWQEQVAEPEIAARRNGRLGEAEAMVASESTLKLFEAATARIDEVRRGVNTELTQAEEDRDRARSLTTRVLVASLGIALGAMFVFRMLLTRWFTVPLDDLRRSVAQVAGGDLDHEIEGVGPPELEEVAVGVENMRRRILTELGDADRARGALARRGLVVLTLRDELAPSKVELPTGWAVAGRFEPAEGIIAGDWWDIVDLGDGRTALALVDVAGHGAATGVYALRTKQLVMAALREGLGPAEVWSWVQRAMGDTGEQFLTGALVVLDPTTGRCRWSSAGHPDLLLVSPSGTITRLEASGPVCGGIPGPWDEEEAVVEPGGFLVAFTDGVIEPRDATGEEFGLDRLVTVVRTTSDSTADAVADACVAAARRHASGRFIDDVTLVVLGRSPEAR